jgi:glucokinase
MLYAGIDLGGTNIAAGLVDENGKVVTKGSAPTGRQRPYGEIIRDMAGLIYRLMDEACVELDDIGSIGIGSPGTPDNDKGILVYANNLPDFINVPLRAEMQKHLNLPIILDNDANCAALAESMAGAAKGARNSVTITLGTGVGSGVVIDGKVYSGFNYSASEMGHMVICAGGAMCTCGRRGCWEAYASATGLIEQTREAAVNNPESLINGIIDGDLDRIDAKTAFDAARQNDPTGKQVVEKYIGYLAEGIVNLVNIFAPDVVVIGGGISKEGEFLLFPLRDIVKRYVYFKGEPQTDIRVAKLGNDAGIVGAAMLGRMPV